MKCIILILGVFATICNVSSFSGRILNGSPSSADDAFAVAVYSAPRNGLFPIYSHLSTGVAISPTIVVVAAQAVFGFEEFRVGINTNDRRTQFTSEVSYSSYHFGYDPITLEYNVGVLRLNTPTVNYITLAPETFTFPVLFGIGFGFYNAESDIPDVSRQAAIQVIDFTECRRLFNQRVVRSTNICGNGVFKFKPGDQGAPAVDFARNQVYTTVSFWNPESEVGSLPVVMTDLTHPEIQEYLNLYLATPPVDIEL